MELEPRFRVIRESIGQQNPPDSIRQSLLQEFARTSRMRARKKIADWALAGLATAAMLTAMVWGVTVRHSAPAAQTKDGFDVVASDDFEAVPYAPVLAAGESVRMVHTELAPDTLARMGMFVASAYADPVSVDLIVGQDDAPLAVRVNEEEDREKEIQ
jgi:hypothetical protein